MRAAGGLLGALWVTGCALFTPHYQRPELAVTGITMQGGNLFQQNFLVALRIHNPNGRALPIERVHAHLRLAGADIASGVITGPFVVAAHADSSIDMRITANLAAGIAAISQHLDAHRNTVDYELDGVVRLDAPWLRALSFHEAGVIPLSDLTH